MGLHHFRFLMMCHYCGFFVLLLHLAGTVPNSTRHNGKKRPISPEQVIRLFGTTSSSSSSVPTSSQYYSNGTRDRAGRRSPASSPPSTTHQVRPQFLTDLLNICNWWNVCCRFIGNEIEVFQTFMSYPRELWRCREINRLRVVTVLGFVWKVAKIQVTHFGFS